MYSILYTYLTQNVNMHLTICLSPIHDTVYVVVSLKSITATSFLLSWSHLHLTSFIELQILYHCAKLFFTNLHIVIVASSNTIKTSTNFYFVLTVSLTINDTIDFCEMKMVSDMYNQTHGLVFVIV